jgi:hypothetical protein
MEDKGIAAPAEERRLARGKEEKAPGWTCWRKPAYIREWRIKALRRRLKNARGQKARSESCERHCVGLARA